MYNIYPYQAMKTLSHKVVKEILEHAGTVREEVKKEFPRITVYSDGPEFYSDELLLETIPCAAYEYIILCWGVEPSRIDFDSVIFALNNNRLKDIKKIIAHALRRLASVNMHIMRNKASLAL